MKLINLFTLTLLVAGSSLAFWRMECRGRVGLGRLDPMVAPGKPSAHVHTIHGSRGFSLASSNADLIKADCTSCAVTQDKSAYWTPAMYFQHANGTYELVPQVGGMLAYYFLNSAPGETGNIVAFPDGFRMIAGDSLRRNYSITGNQGTIDDAKLGDPGKSEWALLGQTSQADLAQRAVAFNCLNYAKPPEASLYRHYLPDKSYLDANCADGIRTELMFGSCWNGEDIDSPDHKSHVAYPDLVINGHCPKTHSVRLPGLFYETIWATNNFKGVDGQFVMSNGDVQGFGYHGDFMMGWESAEFLQQAINTCTNPSGMIEDCPLFTTQSEPVQNQCHMDSVPSLFNEAVEGLIGNELPGNVQIQYGPAPANSNPNFPGTPSQTTVPVPEVGYSAGKTGAMGTPSLGDVFKQNVPTHTATTTSQPAPAVTSPALPPASPHTPAVTLPSTPCTTTTAALVQNDAAIVGASPHTTPPTTVPPAMPTATAPGEFDRVWTEYVTEGNTVQEIIWEEEVVTVYEDAPGVVVPRLAARKRNRAEKHMLHHIQDRKIRRALRA